MSEQVRPGVEVTERGNIYFFYRPAVGAETPQGLVDVQRFHLVLSPEGKDVLRLLTIGKKRLPEPDDSGERFWGFVKKVAHGAEELSQELEGGRDDDNGGRARTPARPAGEGVYALATHGNHTHLLYALELPEEPDEVQRELHIHKEGAYLLSVKNPEAASPPSAGLDDERKADLPPELQERFGDRRFIGVHPPEFLDHEGTEILLMGSADDPGGELGVELDPERETEATADIFQELRIARDSRGEHPVEPLLQGRWA